MINNDPILSRVKALEHNVWAWITSVRDAHQSWKAILDRARSGQPVVVVDRRNGAEPVGIVPWHWVLLLDKMNLLPTKAPRLPLSPGEVEQIKQAYAILYDTPDFEAESLKVARSGVVGENDELLPNLFNE